MGVPQIIQVMDDHFSIKTHGDLGIPNFKRPAYTECMDLPHIEVSISNAHWQLKRALGLSCARCHATTRGVRW